MSEVEWRSQRGSNPRSSARQADMLTTTPWDLFVLLDLPRTGASATGSGQADMLTTTPRVHWTYSMTLLLSCQGWLDLVTAVFLDNPLTGWVALVWVGVLPFFQS